jgi:hypothetical protein
MRRLCLALALLACTACGSSAPTAPAPPALAQVAGGWTGTFEATQAGTPGSIAIVLDLTQAGANVNGTYGIGNGTATGTVSGTVTPTAFSGTLTFNATAIGGQPCTGTFAASGTAGASTMRWTSPGITGNCGNLPTAITIAIQRR